mgnify:CR=1 FL=1
MSCTRSGCGHELEDHRLGGIGECKKCGCSGFKFFIRRIIETFRDWI